MLGCLSGFDRKRKTRSSREECGVVVIILALAHARAQRKGCSLHTRRARRPPKGHKKEGQRPERKEAEGQRGSCCAVAPRRHSSNPHSRRRLSHRRRRRIVCRRPIAARSAREREHLGAQRVPVHGEKEDGAEERRFAGHHLGVTIRRTKGRGGKEGVEAAPGAPSLFLECPAPRAAGKAARAKEEKRAMCREEEGKVLWDGRGAERAPLLPHHATQRERRPFGKGGPCVVSARDRALRKGASSSVKRCDLCIECSVVW